MSGRAAGPGKYAPQGKAGTTRLGDAMNAEIVLALVVSVLAMFGAGFWVGTKTRARRVSD
jgi:hypothetical protein